MFLSVLLMFPGCRCNKETSSEGKNSEPQSLSERGRVVYQANCIACHNGDPKLAGSLGPDVWKSSRDLLEARLIHGTYPEGYKPKRSSRAMAAMPHLANDIDALTAYLNPEE